MMLGGRGHWGIGSFGVEAKEAISPRVALRLLTYMGPHLGQVAAAIGLMLVASAMTLAGPYLLKVAVDTYIARGDQAGLNLVVAVTLLTQVVGNLATSGQIYLVTWVGQSTLAHLRRQIFDHLQRLSLSFFDQQEAGDLMSRMTNDVDVINQLLTNGLTMIFTDILQLVGIVAIMLALNWRLALLSFLVMPLMAVSTVVFAWRARKAYRQTREKIGAVSADLQENISQVRIVQSFARERANQERFDEINRENRDANIGAAAVASAFSPTVDVLGTAATAIVVGAGGLLVLRDQLTLGVIVAFLGYVTRFFQPIRDLAQLYTTLQSASAAGERIFQLLDTAPAIVEPARAVSLPPIRGRVEFRNVGLAYREGEPVLRGINLVAEAGQTVALVGPTGAGKTSIANLIGRFYDVTEGQVLVDGHDVREVSLASLRSQMGIVPQDSFLFSGTIADNIRYGRLEATEEEVVQAAKLVNAHGFISQLPQGYQAQVMERGVNFSLGQRQLISFARAILAQPRLLILDEATSSVDTRTEALIQSALERLLQGRTSFVIAHRLSTIRNADQVLVVEEGQIVERGTHQSLLEARGRYYEIYQMQFREEEKALAPSGIPAQRLAPAA
ncbi:MAG: ABC transporter ATP-binding protein [Chloroflexi bacterium]|nr:ABC transporter ATP-binding protein [Chloroflexota bacterium]